MSKKDADSPLRSLMAEADGLENRTFASLSEAQRDPDGVVVLEGDDGGQIYIVARASDVACSEETLSRLLRNIDEREWPSNAWDMSRVCFERHRVGDVIGGDMGGGLVSVELWVHPRLEDIRQRILDVLFGKKRYLRE
ncbi:MAG TPA: hypothetical protein VGH50_18020 [Candidatus Binatia bacterium]|jgi:hypothetical protein